MARKKVDPNSEKTAVKEAAVPAADKESKSPVNAAPAEKAAPVEKKSKPVVEKRLLPLGKSLSPSLRRKPLLPGRRLSLSPRRRLLLQRERPRL